MLIALYWIVFSLAPWIATIMVRGFINEVLPIIILLVGIGLLFHSVGLKVLGALGKETSYIFRKSTSYFGRNLLKAIKWLALGISKAIPMIYHFLQSKLADIGLGGKKGKMVALVVTGLIIL